MPSGAKKRKQAKKKLQKEAHNTTNNNGTHHEGNDDPKSHDERESDGEVERENNHEEGTKETSLGEENVEEFDRKENPEGNFNDVTVVEDKTSTISSLEDEEVAIEKEKPVVTELGEEEEEEKPSGENSTISEAVYESIEESIPIEESVKQVVSLTEGIPIENSTISDEIDSGLKQKVDELLPPSYEKIEKTETQVVPVVDVASGNSSETTGITTRDDDEGSLPQSSALAAVDRSRDVCRDDHVKESESNKSLDEQPLVSSTPLPVRRTSWMNCCGLFEVFSGGSR